MIFHCGYFCEFIHSALKCFTTLSTVYLRKYRNYSNPNQNHHIFPCKIIIHFPSLFQVFSLPFSSFYSPSSHSFLFSLFQRWPFRALHGPNGFTSFSSLFAFFSPKLGSRFIRRVEAGSVSAFPFFPCIFKGFRRFLFFFFVFFLFEKEENKRESCLRRYETVWGAVKRSKALWGLMEPTVRIEGPETETEAVEEPLPLKKLLYVVDWKPRRFPVGWREEFCGDMNRNPSFSCQILRISS